MSVYNYYYCIIERRMKKEKVFFKQVLFQNFAILLSVLKSSAKIVHNIVIGFLILFTKVKGYICLKLYLIKVDVLLITHISR